MKALLFVSLMAFGSLVTVSAAKADEAAGVESQVSVSHEDEAKQSGLIPADQLDSLEFQVQAQSQELSADMPFDHDRDHRDRDRDRRDDRFRPHPRPYPPPRRGGAWQCTARDLVRTGYRYVDYDLRTARWGAMRECENRSSVGRCYLLGCDRL